MRWGKVELLGLAFEILFLPQVEAGRNQMATCWVKYEEMSENRRCSFKKVNYEAISQLPVEEAGLGYILFFMMKRRILGYFSWHSFVYTFCKNVLAPVVHALVWSASSWVWVEPMGPGTGNGMCIAAGADYTALGHSACLTGVSLSLSLASKGLKSIVGGPMGQEAAGGF